MRNCERPEECKYAREWRDQHPGLMIGERPDAEEDPRLKAQIEAEEKRLQTLQNRAALGRSRLEVAKEAERLHGKLGRPRLKPEEQSVLMSVRTPIWVVDKLLTAAEAMKKSRNKVVVDALVEWLEKREEDATE